MDEPAGSNERESERIVVKSGLSGVVGLWTPFVSATGTIRDVSLTGVSVALDCIERSVTPGTLALVTIGDTSINARVRHVGQPDRPWDPCYGLEFDGTAGEIAAFLTAVAELR